MFANIYKKENENENGNETKDGTWLIKWGGAEGYKLQWCLIYKSDYKFLWLLFREGTFLLSGIGTTNLSLTNFIISINVLARVYIYIYVCMYVYMYVYIYILVFVFVCFSSLYIHFNIFVVFFMIASGNILQ